MQQINILLVIILCLSAMLSAYLAAWTRLHKSVKGAQEFFWILMCVAIYTIGYMIEIIQVNIDGVLLAIKFEYLGISFLPAFLILFTLKFVKKRNLPRWVYLIIMVIPIITIILVWTMDFHNLFYIDPRVISGPFFSVLDFEPGTWYFISSGYLILNSFLTIILFIIYAIRETRSLRLQAIALIIGGSIPTWGEVFYFLGFIPGNIDPGPFSLSLTVVFFWVALFKFRLFELVPAARELAIDSIKEGFLVVDQGGWLRDMNQAAKELPGGEDLRNHEPLPAGNILVDKLKPVLNNEENRVEFSFENKYYSAGAHPIHDDHLHLEGLAILISDVTENVGYMHQLINEASTDMLTGLINRRELARIGHYEMKRSFLNVAPLGVIIFDIDHFKQINDRFGHFRGDEILQNVADCMRRGTRMGDILGRYGGEEFIVFLPGTEIGECKQIAERLRLLITQIESAEIECGTITASFGVFAGFADKDTELDSFIQKADQAMYQAKDLGRNRIVSAMDK